ncbi:uncharacterized protein OCT59_008363 [Rhizophagus irregularis]|uniref:uncharacterized protein n=1 Tax=Rhizophagus irregularis TaxID=588596 RepID=UPI00332597AA|nr:hypothetical protein OCT59_008363 [Rhizophagus irregularis]
MLTYIMLEWIPYNQFNEIKEIGKNGLVTVYSAVWKDGPLYKEYNDSSYTRDSNKKVALKCLHNSQEPINALINEVKKYPTIYNAFQELYGISQNPDTEDYILVLTNFINLANCNSGNEKIDDFIQEMRLKIDNYDDIVFEWIPYNQFNEIKESGKNGLITVYSAVWKDGPLHKKYTYDSYTRNSNKEVALKCLNNSQDSTDFLINEAKKYQVNHNAFQALYGISQNPDTGDYILVLTNFINLANCNSGNEKIDYFIQEKQLKIDNYDDIVFEWIPYDNQLNEIKESGKNGLITVYSAVWKDGPLYKKYNNSSYTRDSNKKVALKCLHNSQEPIDALINEAKKYQVKHNAFQALYGISQKPDTGDYILVLTNFINLANCNSGNEKIDDFIQEKQLKIDKYDDIVFEWIPYNQLNEIKESGKNGLIIVYSAVWKDGPLYKIYNNSSYTRDSNKKVALKCLHNSQEPIDALINEAKKYQIKHKAFQTLYGISQNPDTGDYILVLTNFINLANCNSGNEKIDDFIQEKQLKIDNYYDIVFEWIPYNQLNEIKESGKNGHITVYSAVWKDGPLYNNSSYTRHSNRKVELKCLHNSQEPIDTLINEAKKYQVKHKAFQVLYGISQNPDAGDFILVLNWTSGNEKIDDFIQEMRLKIDNYNDIVFEWIPYDQFNEIKESGKNGLITVYSAVWKNGPLYKKNIWSNYTRNSNKEVALKCLNNSQESIDFLINEAKKYQVKHKAFQALYGISQNPDTGDYILVLIWTSGNEKIDDFIQGSQLKIDNYDDIVLEWIPCNQFNEIKESGKNGLITIYSAVWKDGPLYKKYSNSSYTRDSNKKVALKCLHNSQEPIDALINEAKKYQIKHKAFQTLYGISQNPDTGDYILVLTNFINLANCNSGNEKIDDFIQEKQLKIDNYYDIVFEWIPYNQLNEIKESGKNGHITVYSAVWKDGPLYNNSSYTRHSNRKVELKCLHNSQEPIDTLINEAKKYQVKHKAFQVLYGISQNPDAGDFILVLNWTSGNEKIDDFIQEMRLKIDNYNDIVFEWIPYDQFNEIKESGKNGLITVYSAVWKNGPLYKKNIWSNYTRNSNKEVALKCLNNSQESIDFLINEAKKYQVKHKAFQALYGISQNPDTGDYILVLIWTSGNEKIDDFIQESQLKIDNYDDIVLEWIPCNQFNEIKESGKNGLITIYSAVWKDGPLYKEYSNSSYTRDSNKKVALKCLHNSQESIDFLINEAKKYLTKISKHKAFQVLYGISQNPDTGDYILVLIWTSGNEKIDDFIQERQLKIDNNDDIVFEWIPYNQLNEIKETGKNGLITVYSAVWKNGPLYNKYSYSSYTRNPNKEVALKCLHNSQESIDFLINETKKYPTKHKAFQVLYGISQNPDTGDYIFIQNNYIWTSGNEKIDDFIQELKINNCDDIVFEWIPYNQFNEIKEIGKSGLVTVYSAIWKDGPLYKKSDMWSENYTRDSNKEVALKYLHNSQNSVDLLINKTKNYLTKSKIFDRVICDIYGISQNPDTNNYILVLGWTSGNENIDNLIQEIQLQINNHSDIVFEWIPYNQFNNIKEIDKGGFATVYSANWKNGPLVCDTNKKMYKRNPNRVIALKCLHNSQNITNKFLNEVKEYSINKSSNILNVYGVSQNPNTKEYIMVLQHGIVWRDKNNRPNIFEVEELIKSYHKSYGGDLFIVENEDIKTQFEKAEEYRKANLSFIKNYQITTHPQATYTSRLLNPFTEDLPEYDDNSQCLDQVI